jgi:poly-gamma-glutamate capsule biosynthesis protein CapA/YwtB (metallophosphatase superfamily)
MSEVLQSYEQNRSMESVKEVVCELIRLNGKDCRIGNGSSNELTEQR